MRILFVGWCLFWGSTAIGDSFELPIFKKVNNPNPKIYDSRNHPQGIFVFDFFVTQCCISKENSKHFFPIYQKYKKEKRVQVLDVGFNRPESDYLRWREDGKPPYRILMDKNAIFRSRYNIRGVPRNIVADCNLNIVWESTGTLSQNRLKEMQAAIDTQLSQTCHLEEGTHLSYRNGQTLAEIEEHSQFMREQSAVRCK